MCSLMDRETGWCISISHALASEVGTPLSSTSLQRIFSKSGFGHAHSWIGRRATAMRFANVLAILYRTLCLTGIGLNMSPHSRKSAGQPNSCRRDASQDLTDSGQPTPDGRALPKPLFFYENASLPPSPYPTHGPPPLPPPHPLTHTNCTHPQHEGEPPPPLARRITTPLFFQGTGSRPLS